MLNAVQQRVSQLEADFPGYMVWVVPRAVGDSPYWWCARPWASTRPLDGLVNADNENELRIALNARVPSPE